MTTCSRSLPSFGLQLAGALLAAGALFAVAAAEKTDAAAGQAKLVAPPSNRVRPPFVPLPSPGGRRFSASPAPHSNFAPKICNQSAPAGF